MRTHLTISLMLVLGAGVDTASAALTNADLPLSQGDSERAEARKRALADLKARMKGRYATLSALRDAGKIGETHTGEVALVETKFGQEKVDPKKKDSPTLAAVVAAENQDRKKLYALIATQAKVKPTDVGVQNAIRNFRNASPQHKLLLRSGKWITKQKLDEAKEAERKRRERQKGEK